MVQPDLYLLGIGDNLREAREKSGLKLADASAFLRIREDYLTALESEDFGRLPGKAYAIGFIRSYATYLGLDAEDLITGFKSVAEPDAAEPLPYNMAEERAPIAPFVKWGGAGLLILVVYLIWLFTGAPSQTVSETVSETASETASASSTSSEPSGIRQPENPSPSEPAQTLASNAPITAAPLADAAQSAADAARVEVKELLDDTLAEADTSPVADTLPVADSLPVSDAGADAETAPAADHLVQIRAKRRTWMRIENGEGKVLFSSIVSQGGTFTLEAGTTYFLATRDAGALEYIVDAQAGQSVGRRGQIVTKRQIDRNAIVKAQP